MSLSAGLVSPIWDIHGKLLGPTPGPRICTVASDFEAHWRFTRSNNPWMRSVDKALAQLLTGQADANIRFGELRRLLVRLGFAERIRGDHFIYSREGIEEIINLQPRGGKAKPYQVRQVRSLIARYAPTLRDEE